MQVALLKQGPKTARDDVSGADFQVGFWWVLTYSNSMKTAHKAHNTKHEETRHHHPVYLVSKYDIQQKKHEIWIANTMEKVPSIHVHP